ncbi:hypothetical protein FQN60_014871 [Etheostoma spectabile]|uniref:CUB and zona pellucida-like domain-containing protein 1 n=1 Tax=Etheostoma spectabile TaxID=54343 RepID=A0A5J5CSB8_9PERO|nr:hypothetical protein FQN60_014871 [Etheostoma spectabile]
MWTLLVLCSVVASHGVQGVGRFQTTEEMNPPTISPDVRCGSQFYSSRGTFYSPNYPGLYPHYADCIWNITPGSRIVQLDFRIANIEYHSTCAFDAIYVYDGPSTSSRLLGKITVYPHLNQQQLPSCRYNCGWDLGSCSCTSSCQYYGNCCRDHQYYCPTTTHSPPSSATCLSTTAKPITAQPSCRYNCGRHMGSCSCSSSCQYNGNCCYDYYSYCPSPTTAHCPSPTTAYCSITTNMPATVKPCGGSLFGSGTFSSPNHPNYYHDNAYCVWQLRAAFDQRIFLEFTYLQLENCCSCDYISIYDGPSVSSRYLGKVCNNSLSSFYSTSNYLTVLFRTDGSVVGRGFNADFISSLPPSSDNMNIVIERTYLNSLGYDGHSLYLNDPHCRPQVSTYQVVFNFPINTCGNIRKFENDRVVYTNTLHAYTSSSGEITRQSHFKMNVGCRMEQDSVAQIMYVVEHRDNSSITGTGRFNTSMDFYTSSNFYYKVSIRGDTQPELICPSEPEEGCPVDNTYVSYITGTQAYARFTFKAFQFLRATESVYIQCKVLICQASDYNSRCRRGCNKRAARDLGSEHDRQTLVLGPIKLKDPEKKEEETPKQDKA